MNQNMGVDDISLNNLRECRFYISHLNNIFDFENINIDFTSIMNMNSHIKTNFRLCCNNNKEDMYRLLQDFKEKYKNELIKESDFGSLLTDDRANYYTWLSLKSSLKTGIITTSYNYPEINYTPSSLKERSNCILSIMDAWTAKKETKLLTINYIRNGFLTKYKEFKNPFKWIDKKNSKQCDFAYEYTINFFNENQINKSNALDYITPISDNEKYGSIIAIFDFWLTYTESKKLFLININKAWNQQKFRENVKNKKQSLNTYISRDAKKILDELTIKHNKKINEMIEYLIYKGMNEKINFNENK